MTSLPDPPPNLPSDVAATLRPAIVLGSTENECRALGEDSVIVVPYAQPFPRPRQERVMPGHLVAVATSAEGKDIVLWRWFDGVVVDRTEGNLTLWEPNHGFVGATARDAARVPALGSRGYLSAGLPGAQWWLAGPTVERPQDAEVELAEVADFFTGHGLWNHLT